MRGGRDIAIVNEIELMYLSQLNKLLIEVIDGERLIKIEEIKQLQPHLAAFCSEAKKQRATEIIQARKKIKALAMFDQSLQGQVPTGQQPITT